MPIWCINGTHGILKAVEINNWNLARFDGRLQRGLKRRGGKAHLVDVLVQLGVEDRLREQHDRLRASHRRGPSIPRLGTAREGGSRGAKTLAPAEACRGEGTGGDATRKQAGVRSRRGETRPHGMRRPVWPSRSAAAVAAWGRMGRRRGANRLFSPPLQAAGSEGFSEAGEPGYYWLPSNVTDLDYAKSMVNTTLHGKHRNKTYFVLNNTFSSN